MNFEILREKYKKTIFGVSFPLAITLWLSILASLLAKQGWLFDLFSHFTFQYIIGGIFISALLFLGKHYKSAIITALLVIFCIGEIAYKIDGFAKPSDDGKPLITLAQYNMLFLQFNTEAIEKWISSNDFDVINFQEANGPIEKMGREMLNRYPYQLRKSSSGGAFGTLIISKYPFIESELITLKGPVFKNTALHISIKPVGYEKPVSIYALHTLPPMGKTAQKQRNFELSEIAQKIADDPNKNIIMMGDWNITPYSPYFSDTLKAADLTYQTSSLIPTPTWPALAFPWIMQIPLDHIVSTSNLQLVKSYRDRIGSSDHHPLIASFAEK